MAFLNQDGERIKLEVCISQPVEVMWCLVQYLSLKVSDVGCLMIALLMSSV